MEKNQSKWNQKMEEILGFIASLPFLILLLSSIGIFLYQLYIFAKSGNWLSISISDLTNFDWIQNNWLGIYKILVWLPASLTLFILSWVVLFFTAYLIDDFKKN